MDLSTFTQQELPAFAAWLKDAGLPDEAREVLDEHTKRLDEQLQRVRREIREARNNQGSEKHIRRNVQWQS